MSDAKKYCIFDHVSKKYVVEYDDKTETAIMGSEENRMIFYDHNDAMNVRDALDEKHDGLYAILTEDKKYASQH